MIREIVKKAEKYKNTNVKSDRKKKAQFFTSENSALFMGKSSSFSSSFLKILDPGAGNGLLGASVVSYCIKNNLCKKFHITFVESDETILPLLQETVALMKAFALKHHVDCTCEVIHGNFLTQKMKQKYDIVISNPPYKKIRKDSEESKAMSDYVYGQPNLYGLFMAKGADLLRDGGRFVYIVPRSWTSGDYYKRIRKHLLSHMNILSVLLFADRENAYSKEEVLQETMILTAEKSDVQNEYIDLYTVEDDSFSKMDILHIPASDIKNIGDEHYLLLPTSQSDLETIRRMAVIEETFFSLGYEFKTGPVVEYRNKDMLSTTGTEKTVPMFRSANISSDGLVFPADTLKPQYVLSKAGKLLIKNENTVLLRRLSAKEEPRRLQSCIYLKRGHNKYISIENHVNYLTRKDKTPLTIEEVNWINNILMSEDYDVYYRILNGSTQVNAGEVNRLPLRRRG